MQEFGDLISSLGFPIVVAMFVLFRMNGKFDRLRESIDKLIERMDRHAEERRKEGD